jgi:hypothetical protein
VPSEINHNSLLNFVAAEHYRWDTDISSTATIHTNNITDLNGAGVSGSANQILTDNGDGTVTSESLLTFENSGNISTLSFLSNQDTGDKFTIGTTTNGATTFTTVDDDATAADLIFSPDGDAIFNLRDADTNSLFKISVGATNHFLEVAGESGNYSRFKMYEQGGDSADDYFNIDVSEHGETVISTFDNAATAANLTLDVDGDLTENCVNYTLDASGTVEINSDGNSIMFKDGATEIMEVTSSKLNLLSQQGITFEGTPDAHETTLAFTDPTADRTITFPDATGTVQLQGINAGKQLQVFICNFFDNIGTTTHYIPFKDINEQTAIYQDEVAMHAPCDGRIVSVSISMHSVSANGNLTVSVHTRSVNNSMLVSPSSWTDQETETLAVTSTDDNHTFHFAFDNAKHFDSTQKVSLSITSDSSLGASSFFYTTVVVEWDWTTFLGTTSAEIDSTP